jgi:1,2-diacylglycerol 3-alpha-glucosyltransferase
MHILMLSHGYPPTISGVTLVVQKVAKAMVSRGHQVTVVTASDRGAPYQVVDEGVILRRVRSAPNPFWSEGRLPLLTYDRLREIIDEVRPDVINTHDGALLSWQLYLFEGGRSHVPEVLTCHFLPRFVSYYIHVGDRVERMIENLTWEVTVRMINGFDHVIFPTCSQEAMFRKEGLEAPSTVISNGFDAQRYNPNGDVGDIERRYGLPQGPRVLFVGRLARDKKIDILIRAFARIETGHLLLVGRGDDRQRLEDLAGGLGLRRRVHFMGFVPETDLPGIYRAASLFAIASDVEVQSIPTLQAVGTGLPIVAADAAALPELVQDGNNGYLARPGDVDGFAAAMRCILGDLDRASAFGQASLEIGRRHSEDRTFRAYEQLYSALALAEGQGRVAAARQQRNDSVPEF